MMKKIFCIISALLLLSTIMIPVGGITTEIKKNHLKKYTYGMRLSDFEVDAYCGGFAPWTPLYRIQIDQNGHVIYSIMPAENRDTGGFSVVEEFDFTESEMNQLWDVIGNNDFFNLDPLYSTITGDGTFANVTITNGETSHSVETRNIANLQFDNISKFINSLTPGDYDLVYNAILNVPPKKPLTPSGQPSGNIKNEYTYSTSTADENLDDIYYWFEWGDSTNSGWIGPYKSGEIVNCSHKWNNQGSYNITVRAKDDPDRDGDLSDGYESFWSDSLPVKMPKKSSNLFHNFLNKLSEKFSFFKFLFNRMDLPDTKILSNNLNGPSGTRVTIKDCEIKVDIYIQIHGPGATVDLTKTIETDIEDMWNTDKEGDGWMVKCKEDCDPREPGCSVEFDAHVVRMDSMHSLPGFHSWYVGTDPTGTNHGAVVTMWDYDGDGVGDGPTGNDQTVPTTTGRVDNNEPDNTYAHEAGHLMGLQDQYHELPAQDRDGDGDIDADDRRTEPNADHEEDIMGTLNGKPLQSAIDEIVSDAGIECPCECCPEEEDDEEPDIDIDSPQDGSSTSTPLNVTGSASDIGGSGVAELDFKLEWNDDSKDGDSYYFDPPVEETGFILGPINLENYIEIGDWMKITVYAIDAAGNIGQDSVTVTWVEDEEDTIPPVTIKTVGEPNEEGGYVIFPMTPIWLDATDEGGSGVEYIYYEIAWDSNEDGIYDETFSETVYGSHVEIHMEFWEIFYGMIELRWYAVDNAGNQETMHYQEHLVIS